VHGLTKNDGKIVGTKTAQVLENKTLTNPDITIGGNTKSWITFDKSYFDGDDKIGAPTYMHGFDTVRTGTSPNYTYPQPTKFSELSGRAELAISSAMLKDVIVDLLRPSYYEARHELDWTECSTTTNDKILYQDDFTKNIVSDWNMKTNPTTNKRDHVTATTDIIRSTYGSLTIVPTIYDTTGTSPNIPDTVTTGTGKIVLGQHYKFTKSGIYTITLSHNLTSGSWSAVHVNISIGRDGKFLVKRPAAPIIPLEFTKHLSTNFALTNDTAIVTKILYLNLENPNDPLNTQQYAHASLTAGVCDSILMYSKTYDAILDIVSVSITRIPLIG
jgi:hypothetical protein